MRQYHALDCITLECIKYAAGGRLGYRPFSVTAFLTVRAGAYGSLRRQLEWQRKVFFRLNSSGLCGLSCSKFFI